MNFFSSLNPDRPSQPENNLPSASPPSAHSLRILHTPLATHLKFFFLLLFSSSRLNSFKRASVGLHLYFLHLSTV